MKLVNGPTYSKIDRGVQQGLLKCVVRGRSSLIFLSVSWFGIFDNIRFNFIKSSNSGQIE